MEEPSSTPFGVAMIYGSLRIFESMVVVVFQNVFSRKYIKIIFLFLFFYKLFLISTH